MRTIFVFTATVFLILSCNSKTNLADKQSEDDFLPRNYLCAPQKGQALTIEDDKTAPLFDGMGDYHFAITTKSELAQKYFDQGMVLAYGFNHAEAARSFKEATKQDPDCAMCWWGFAYVLGPNYNAGMEPDVMVLAFQNIQKALRLAENATQKEKDMISTMEKRYSPTAVDDRSPYDQAYSDDLKKLYKKYPNDDDITAMYAESLMDLHPWDLYDKDETPKEWTGEIVSLLETVLNRNERHVGANHFYIHAVEASSNPHRGLPSADRLGGLTPGAGHLVHMPSHIYIRTGNYHKGTVVNKRAIAQDKDYVSACHAAGVYPMALYPHNFHFLIGTAGLEGNSSLALDAAKKMVSVLDNDIMKQPGWGAVQHYFTIPWYVMVKFAKWDEILNETMPEDDLKYPQAVLHYARGMAFSGKTQLEKAEQELAILKTLLKTEEETFTNVTIWDLNTTLDLVKIAVLVLEGEINFQRGNYDKAAQLLREAIVIEDNLNYTEPPDWFFSVRHILGPILLKAGKYFESEQLYRDDLKKFPETGYALNGLYKSLVKQNKMAEAKSVKKRFEKAWRYADVDLDGSIMVMK